MEQFLHGAYVRLRSRVLGGYLLSDEDGVGVSLSLGWRRGRGSMNAAWRVHRVLHDDDATYVLLAIAASSSPDDNRVVQGAYDDHRNRDPILWVAVGKAEGGYVVVRHVSYRLLRADVRRYRRWNWNWNNDVSVDDVANYSKMMHWVVEAIPASPMAPELPGPTPVSSQPRPVPYCLGFSAEDKDEKLRQCEPSKGCTPNNVLQSNRS